MERAILDSVAIAGDRMYREMAIGKWTCEEKDAPHTIDIRPDGSFTMTMSATTFVTGVMSFFTGRQVDGTWSIHEGIISMSFEDVTRSWLNFEIGFHGLKLKIPYGNLTTRLTSIFLNIKGASKCKIESIDDDSVWLRIPASGDDNVVRIRWTRQRN